MKILPLSGSTRGLRSTALQVLVGRTRLFFNPGVIATPGESVAGARARIVETASRADALLVTGYAPYQHNLLPDLPSTASLYLSVPKTAEEWRQLHESFLPLNKAGLSISLADKADTRVGDARVAWSQEHGCTAVTVQGDGRTLVYTSQASAQLSSDFVSYLVAQQLDLLYLSIAAPLPALVGASTGAAETLTDGAWHTEQPTSLAGNLLGLIAATGCRILLEGLPIDQPACRRLFRAPLATGRLTLASEWAAPQPASSADITSPQGPAPSLALAR